MRRKLVVVLGIVVVGVVLACVYVTQYLPSQIFWSRPTQPVPTEGAIVEARAKATREVTGLFRDVDAHCAQAGLKYYDTGTLDSCYPGHHNWKVNAPFENRCRYSMVKYYGFGGDFRVAMMSLDGALVAAGWERYAGGLPSILTGYYDPSYGPDKPKPPNFPKQYLVSDIPGAAYNRGGAGPRQTWPPPMALRLFVRYEERDPTGRVQYRHTFDLMTRVIGRPTPSTRKPCSRPSLSPTGTPSRS